MANGSKLDRLRSQLAKVKVERQDQIDKATTLGLVMGGAFAAGYIPQKYPSVATIGGIRFELAVGGTLIAAGLMDWFDDYSDEALALGAGMVAADMARRGRDMAGVVIGTGE